MTDFVPIIKQLEEESEKFRQAAQIIRDLQSQSSSNGAPTRGPKLIHKSAVPRKHRMSAAARKKISAAQRARWAKIRNIGTARSA